MLWRYLTFIDLRVILKICHHLLIRLTTKGGENSGYCKFCRIVSYFRFGGCNRKFYLRKYPQVAERSKEIKEVTQPEKIPPQITTLWGDFFCEK